MGAEVKIPPSLVQQAHATWDEIIAEVNGHERSKAKLGARVVERELRAGSASSRESSPDSLERKSEKLPPSVHSGQLRKPKTLSIGSPKFGPTHLSSRIPLFSDVAIETPNGLRLDSARSGEKIEIVGANAPGLADRLAVPKDLAAKLSPAPPFSKGDSAHRIALFSVTPAMVEALPLTELDKAMTMLSAQKVRVRWWKEDGSLSAQHLFQSKRKIRGDVALILAMRVRGGDVACNRLLTVAGDKAVRAINHVGASAFIREDNIAMVMQDAVDLLFAGTSVSAHRAQISKQAAKSVTQYFEHCHASLGSKQMNQALDGVMKAANGFDDEKRVGAFVGIVTAGMLTYLTNVKARDYEIANAAKSGKDFALTFMEEAPGGKIAAKIVSLAIDAAIDEVAKRAHGTVSELAKNFFWNLKFEVLQERRLPGASLETREMTPQEVTNFLQYMEMTMSPPLL